MQGPGGISKNYVDCKKAALILCQDQGLNMRGKRCRKETKKSGGEDGRKVGWKRKKFRQGKLKETGGRERRKGLKTEGDR